MAANTFSQVAVLSTSSHFSHIALQQWTATWRLSYSMIFISSLKRPSNIPMVFQSVAYSGVTYSYKSFSSGALETVNKIHTL